MCLVCCCQKVHRTQNAEGKFSRAKLCKSGQLGQLSEHGPAHTDNPKSRNDIRQTLDGVWGVGSGVCVLLGCDVFGGWCISLLVA